MHPAYAAAANRRTIERRHPAAKPDEAVLPACPLMSDGAKCGELKCALLIDF